MFRKGDIQAIVNGLPSIDRNFLGTQQERRGFVEKRRILHDTKQKSGRFPCSNSSLAFRCGERIGYLGGINIGCKQFMGAVDEIIPKSNCLGRIGFW